MDKMSIPLYKYLLPVAAALCLTACQSDLLSSLGVDDPTAMFESATGLKGPAAAKEKMVVNKVEFSDDYKKFSVWTGIVSDIGPYSLTDSTVVQIEVESYDDGVKSSRWETPVLVKAWNTEKDRVSDMGVKMLVLVDLSLSQELIDKERDAVLEMLTVFPPEDLYVAFMSGNTVTPSRQVSDYILKQYFKKWSDQKCLFRSILDKVNEIQIANAPWADARQVKLLILSDGAVYDADNIPFDPDHFSIENQLLHSFEPGQDFLNVYYVSLDKKGLEDEDSESIDVMSSVCQSSGGASFPQFNWTQIEDAMLGSEVRAVASNRFDFVNPDGKVYRGDNQEVKLKFYTVQDHKLIASATAKIQAGSLFEPIIVHGATFTQVLLEGLSAGLFLLLALYCFFQFLVPYIKYRLFLKKYVIRHTGKKMVIGDVAVAESCYLCKAPFEEGDEVVVKCEHTMHKHCWDENEYHCPEFGRRCQHGSHFYDKDHLMDKRNAPYYMNWLLMGVIMGVCAWFAFAIYTANVHKHLIDFLMPSASTDKELIYAHLNPLPSYGFMLAFFLTLGIAFLATRKLKWTSYADIFLRALAAGVGSSILFILTSMACIALRLDSFGVLVNIIPWALSSFLSALMGTLGTRIQLKKSIILIAVGVSTVSMLLWSLFYIQIGVDFRVLLLYSTLLYMVGMSLAIASVAPRSEHYFLHVQGAVKSMDVALYKWFRANPKAVVTIGKSVDCSLQLSWDLRGKVAPVHAEITMNRGVLQLKALEEGVLLEGKPLPVDQLVILHHGRQFQIGQTLFTYEEKDI